jgi:hypothetical protein
LPSLLSIAGVSPESFFDGYGLDPLAPTGTPAATPTPTAQSSQDW